jgi:uncharacterized protein (DUF433 family)
MTTPTTELPIHPVREKTSLADRIVSTAGTCGGRPRIAGTRITVEHIAIWYTRMAMTPDEIVSEYSHLTLSDVHSALAYYYEHKDQIEEEIRRGRELEERLRAGQPSVFEKLKGRDARNDSFPHG